MNMNEANVDAPMEHRKEAAENPDETRRKLRARQKVRDRQRAELATDGYLRHAMTRPGGFLRHKNLKPSEVSEELVQFYRANLLSKRLRKTLKKIADLRDSLLEALRQDPVSMTQVKELADTADRVSTAANWSLER